MGSAEGSPTLSYAHGGEIGIEAKFSSLTRFLAKGYPVETHLDFVSFVE